MWLKISKQELRELLEAYHRLQALECGGVDNWEWYGESINDFIYEVELRNIGLEPSETIELEHLVRDQLLKYEVLEV